MAENQMVQMEKYTRFVRRKKLVFLIAAAATLVIALFSIGVGSIQIPVKEIIGTIFGRGELQSQTVIMGIRLPRVTAAILVGAILATSGAVMQCVLRNPLASASTLGVSQGAAFGAALGIIVFGGGVVNSASAASAVTIDNPYIVTLCAFVFGALSTVVIIAISQLKKDIGPAGLVLAGVALCSLIYFMLNRWNYNAMESGADTAKSLGVNTRVVMVVSMAICSLAASVAVSFVGIISFVGLVAPHIMRRFVGNDFRYLVPCSAVAGALLLILADTFGKWIIAPVILPIGAITSFLGAPMFLFLLFKGVKTNG